MVRQIIYKLQTINPWHYIWIILVFAEIMTAFMNTIQSLIWWGRISKELLFIGTIDAFINALIISPIFLIHINPKMV